MEIYLRAWHGYKSNFISDATASSAMSQWSSFLIPQSAKISTGKLEKTLSTTFMEILDKVFAKYFEFSATRASQRKYGLMRKYSGTNQTDTSVDLEQQHRLPSLTKAVFVASKSGVMPTLAF